MIFRFLLVFEWRQKSEACSLLSMCSPPDLDLAVFHFLLRVCCPVHWLIKSVNKILAGRSGPGHGEILPKMKSSLIEHNTYKNRIITASKGMFSCHCYFSHKIRWNCVDLCGEMAAITNYNDHNSFWSLKPPEPLNTPAGLKCIFL